MYRQRFPHTPASPLKNAASAVIGLTVLVLGLMFSVVLLAGLVVAGLAAWGYVWWKTREIRRILRERQAPAAANDRVFEGEATVVETEVQVTRIDAGNSARL